MFAIDSETTGKDHFHGAKPYFVTICHDDGEQIFWEWDVCPRTRQPQIPPGDIADIQNRLDVAGKWGEGFDEEIAERHTVILQNARFDAHALWNIGVKRFPWHQAHDTLISGHLLASNQPHDLTAMVLHWLGYDIQPFEDALEKAVKEVRGIVQRAYNWKAKGAVIKAPKKRKGKDSPDLPFPQEIRPEDDPRWELAEWRISEEGLPEMPSAKSGKSKKGKDGKEKKEEGDRLWKQDGWLPRVYAKFMWENSEAGKAYASYLKTGFPGWTVIGNAKGWEWKPPGIDEDHHPYWTVLQNYANPDSACTMRIWIEHKKELLQRGLWKIYQESRRLPRVIWDMEHRGVTGRKDRARELKEEYTETVEELDAVCVGIAADYNYDLVMPKGGANNQSLSKFCFDVMKLEPVYNPKSKTGAPTLDKTNAYPFYLTTLEPRSKPLLFIKSLYGKRDKSVMISYINGYERFWLNLEPWDTDISPKDWGDQWFVLHPQLNQTGSDTLRFSSSNPNSQNFKRGEDEHGRSLRYIMGPAPGREWWTIDAQNIEARLPAYVSGEPDLIALFERPKDPPFYGSEHLLNFSIVYPDLWAKAVREVGLDNAGPYVKERYEATWYRFAKLGKFALQYGAVLKKDGWGTADKAFRKQHSHALLLERLSKLQKLTKETLAYANKWGYVETLPDREVDPTRGYPLMTQRTTWGDVQPTLPFSYKIQGSAMWWTRRAMVKTSEICGQWNRDVVRQGKNLMRHGYFPTLQVHDEIVFDFPKRDCPLIKPKSSNRDRIRKIADAMESCGPAMGVPTPVEVKYCPDHWGEGRKISW